MSIGTPPLSEAAAIEMEVTLNERVQHAFFLWAKITVGGKLAAQFDFGYAMAKV